MAINPQIQPSQDPNYLRYSRATDMGAAIRETGEADRKILPKGQAVGDESGKYEYAGIGDAVSGVATLLDTAGKAGDFYVKQDIDKKVYSAVEKERTDITQAYEVMTGLATDGPTGKPMNLLPGEEGQAGAGTKEMPADVASVDRVVSGLQNAKVMGKIPDTYYKQRLMEFAKNLRTEHPGYRDYIDHKISGITGFDPANAYLKNMEDMFTKMISDKDAQKDKISSFILTHAGKSPFAATLYTGWQRGDYTPGQIIKEMSALDVREGQLRLLHSEFENGQNNRKAGEQNAQDVITTTANGIVSDQVRGMTEIKAGGGFRNINDLKDYLFRVSQGTEVAPEQKLKDLQVAVKGFKEQARGAIQKELSRRTSDGRTMLEALGGQEGANKHINAALSTYDEIDNIIGADKTGLIFKIPRMIESLSNEDKFGLLTSDIMLPGPDGKPSKTGLAALIRTSSVASQLLGPEVASKLTLGAFEKNLDKGLQSFIDLRTAQLFTPPAQQTIPPNGNNDIKEPIEKLKNAGVKDGSAYRQFTDIPAMLAKPGVSDAAKIEGLTNAFKPSNRGVLANFDSDKWDPAKGQWIQGRHSVFVSMTSPEITREIRRLADQKPELWTNYVRWAQTEFGEQIFSKEIHDLNNVVLPKGVTMDWQTTSKHFIVNTNSYDKHRTGDTRDLRPNIDSVPEVVAARASVEKLNRGLDNMRVIAETAKSGDVDAYLLQNLVKYGFDPSSKTAPITFPEHIMRSLMPPMKEEPGVKKGDALPEKDQRLGMNLEPLHPKGSLGEWLQSPDGSATPPTLPIADIQKIQGPKTLLDDGSIVFTGPDGKRYRARPKTDAQGRGR